MSLSNQQKNRLNKLITLVTLRVDEYTKNLDQPVPEVPVGDVEHELNEAAKSILRRVSRLSGFASTKRQTNVSLLPLTERGGTAIPLADDFLRFVSLKMKGWKRAASDFVSDTSRIYQQQIYAQRRGTQEKPVVAMVPFLEEFERNFDNDKGEYFDADPEAAASVTLTLGGWNYVAESLIQFTIDGITLRVGGFNSSGTFSGGQAASTLRNMLRGDHVPNARFYDKLPDGYTVTSTANTLKITRNEKAYNPIAFTLSTAFANEVDVTGVATEPGFSGEPLINDDLLYNGEVVGYVESVDSDKGEAILNIDGVFLSIGNELTAESGKYKIKITGLTKDKYTTTTEAKRALEAYPASNEVESLVYIPYLKAYEMPTDYDDALVWEAAASVLMIMRLGDVAGNAMGKAEKALQELNVTGYADISQ